MNRDGLKKVSRLVVKVGTGVLTNARNQPDQSRMRSLARELAEQHRAGRQVILVSSGAVGAGMGRLGLTRRPSELPQLQACAAVGQSRLMAIYERCFRAEGLAVAQVLLTHDDLRHKDRHLSARNTLVTLLEQDVIPIINENDAISFTELRPKFGDNDRLSALVACLLPADLLVILTTVDGVMANFGEPDAHVMPTVEKIDGALERQAKGTMSATAVGGMSAKIEAAKMVMRSGIPLVIAGGKQPGSLASVMQGENVGTLFLSGVERLRGRKRWIAFFHHPGGSVTVDDGARDAIRDRGKSLLAPGIRGVDGGFQPGEVIRILDSNGLEFARGMTDLSAEELRKGGDIRRAVVHRDNLVVL